MLIGLPNTYPAEKLGPKLMAFLAGDAELAVEHIKVEDLAKANGEKAVFKALDERYKPLERNKMNEALKEFFFETQIPSAKKGRRHLQGDSVPRFGSWRNRR